MAVRKKFNALGRGLDALISTDEVRTEGSSSINEVEVSQIFANPRQPRREFDPAALQELAASIANIGLVQPITLRKMDDDTYQIIAGERRWRAAQMAGLSTVPAYVRTADDETMMEMALVENIQREDLNAIEVALAYEHLISQYQLTQEQLSEKVGKNRTTITNYLRLLKLPAAVQMALQEKTIDMGHARALLGVDNAEQQLEVFKQIIQHGLSVRKVEELIKQLNNHNKHKNKKDKADNHTPEEFTILKEKLSNFFHTKVTLNCTDKGKGKITIPFANEEEMERIIELFDHLRS